MAIAVAQNAVVIADTKKVTALALKDGKQLWSEALPAAPVPWGMAVDRTGTAEWIATGVVSALGSSVTPLVLIIVLAVGFGDIGGGAQAALRRTRT